MQEHRSVRLGLAAGSPSYFVQWVDTVMALSPSDVPEKVIIWFKAAGSAPTLKQAKYKLSANGTIGRLQGFLRQNLSMREDEPLFLFIDASFQPAPDSSVGTLYKCFGSAGKLIVNYSNTQAWG